MRISEIQALATPEIEAKLDNMRDEMFRLRFRLRTGQLTDVSALRTARRTIARLETVLHARQSAAGTAAEVK